jgi:two-component system, NtrC family, sensor kinase
MGKLAGGLVHEVNNPATFIALAAGQIEKTLARTPPSQKLEEATALARDIGESMRQMKNVVSDFHLLLAVVRHAMSGSLDLARMLRACATLTQVSYHTQAKVSVDVHELPACPASFAALAAVVVSLLINAIQSVSAAGQGVSEIHLKAWARDDRLELSVSDTGCGMEPEVLAKVFDPFFTTRPASQAAGLGLTMARETVRSLHGEIVVESRPGVGTTVSLSIPLGPGNG